MTSPLRFVVCVNRRLGSGQRSCAGPFYSEIDEKRLGDIATAFNSFIASHNVKLA